MSDACGLSWWPRRLTGFGCGEGLGNQAHVCLYGDADDTERLLSLPYLNGNRCHQVGGLSLESGRLNLGCMDANREAGVFGRVCEAQSVEPAHHSLVRALSGKTR